MFKYEWEKQGEKEKKQNMQKNSGALTVALLVGQSHAFVLAEEGAGNALQTEISSEETETDRPGGEDGQNQCICETACTEDAVNADCPVCAADYANCIGKKTEAVLNDVILENDLAGNVEMVSQAAVNEQQSYTVGDKFSAESLNYQVISDGADNGKVKVIKPSSSSMLPQDLIIPATVTDDNGREWDVTTIDIWAFQNCRYLKNVEIQEGITKIDFEAFNCCTSMESVKIPESVTQIGGRTFSDCLSLEKVKIPDNISNIVGAMFLIAAL